MNIFECELDFQNTGNNIFEIEAKNGNGYELKLTGTGEYFFYGFSKKPYNHPIPQDLVLITDPEILDMLESSEDWEYCS